ncbi:MAG: cupin domain-containing protein [Rhodospirillales bacterium]|nr:cupin domain-containing protein [Rhodospirillales bacterium]
MPFHRFEDYEAHFLTPHLSSGKAPIIEGKYMYFCLISKEAGTGSELHYHPNELLIFPVEGKINAVVGKDRRIVSPGTFVHAPPNARHSMKATEDGPVHYLYIKDQTWTVVGLAENEARPDKAMTVEEVNKKFSAGEIQDKKGRQGSNSEAVGDSDVIIEGLNDCYYPIVDSLDAPPCSGNRISWVEGERLAFGFFEYPSGYRRPAEVCQHEEFMYVIGGGMDMRVDNDSQSIGPGHVVEAPKGAEREFTVTGEGNVRFVVVRSMAYLEEMIDKTRAAE